MAKYKVPNSLQHIVASICAGVFFSLSFPPFNLGLLYIFGIALFVYLIKDNVYHIVPGIIVFYGILCVWLYSFGIVAYVCFLIAILLITLSLLFIFNQFVELFGNPLLLFPFFIVLVELIAEHIPVVGFPWLPFGLPYANNKIFAGLISVVGIHGMTFLTFLFAYFIYLASSKNFMFLGYVLLVSILLVSFSTFLNVHTKSNYSVTTIQPGKLNNPTERTLTVLSTLKKSDILVTPESGIMEYSYDQLIDKITNKINDNGVAVVNLSITDKSPVKIKTRFSQIAKKEHQFNVNFTFYKNKSKLEYKMKMVPFGEYVPGELFIGWMPVFDQIYPRYSKAAEPVKGSISRISSSICYEVAFSNYIASKIEKNNIAHAVTTNNTSYNIAGIANIKQQLTHSKARAIENGITVIQSSLGGESAIIAPNGEVVTSLEKGKVGYLSGETQGKIHFMGLNRTIFSYFYKYQLIAYFVGFVMLLFFQKKLKHG